MRQQLIALRRELKAEGIDAYIIPTTDFHGSEYVNEYFKCREFFSGCTGIRQHLSKHLSGISGFFYVISVIAYLQQHIVGG